MAQAPTQTWITQPSSEHTAFYVALKRDLDDLLWKALGIIVSYFNEQSEFEDLEEFKKHIKDTLNRYIELYEKTTIYQIDDATFEESRMEWAKIELKYKKLIDFIFEKANNKVSPNSNPWWTGEVVKFSRDSVDWVLGKK